MLASSILDAVAWHAMACWVDVIKSLIHLIPELSNNATAVTSTGAKNNYVWQPPVQAVFSAGVITGACISVTSVVLVIEYSYRKRPSTHNNTMTLNPILHIEPNGRAHIPAQRSTKFSRHAQYSEAALTTNSKHRRV